MSYRDDHQALEARLDALERDNEHLRAENKRLRATQERPHEELVELLFRRYLEEVVAQDDRAISADEICALVRDVEKAHGVDATQRQQFRKKLLDIRGALAIEGRTLMSKNLPNLSEDLATLLE